MPEPFTVTDWQGRPYTVEIAYVRFLGGYVLWVDDDPYNEGEPFLSRRAALAELKRKMKCHA